MQEDEKERETEIESRQEQVDARTIDCGNIFSCRMSDDRSD